MIPVRNGVDNLAAMKTTIPSAKALSRGNASILANAAVAPKRSSDAWKSAGTPLSNHRLDSFSLASRQGPQPDPRVRAGQARNGQGRLAGRAASPILPETRAPENAAAHTGGPNVPIQQRRAAGGLPEAKLRNVRLSSGTVANRSMSWTGAGRSAAANAIPTGLPDPLTASVDADLMGALAIQAGATHGGNPRSLVRKQSAPGEKGEMTQPGVRPDLARARFPASPTIQAKIVVQQDEKDKPGEPGYRDHVRENLQQLAAPGTKVHVDPATGEVRMEGEPEERDREHPGHVLLQRMIAHEHQVTIGNKGKEPLMRPPNAAATAGPSEIDFPRDSPPQMVSVQREEGLRSEPLPLSITLGHELIHADHMQRGVFIPTANKTRHEYQVTTPEGGVENEWEPVDTEELHTVGLGERRHGDVTENDLRDLHRLPKRVSYYAHHDNKEKNAKLMAEQLESAREAREEAEAAAGKERLGRQLARFRAGIYDSDDE